MGAHRTRPEERAARAADLQAALRLGLSEQQIGRALHIGAATLAAACAAHLSDLAAAYPGLYLTSLAIPEGYGGYRPSLSVALPLTASVAACCAELGGAC